MKKTTVIAALIAAIIAPLAFGQANIIATGEIEIGANDTAQTVSANIGLYDRVRRVEWGQVVGAIIKNGAGVAATTTVSRVDLGDNTAILSQVVGATSTLYSACAVYTGSTNQPVPVTLPAARDLKITVGVGSNASPAVVEYIIFAK